jgi:hypothetical protein
MTESSPTPGGDNSPRYLMMLLFGDRDLSTPITAQELAEWERAISAALLAEREACAKVADECVLGFSATGCTIEAADRISSEVSAQIAAAIRSRKP